MHDIEDPIRVSFDRSSPSRFFGRGGPFLTRMRVDYDCIHADRTISQRAIRRFGVGKSHGRVIIVCIDRRELGTSVRTRQTRVGEEYVGDLLELVKRM